MKKFRRWNRGLILAVILIIGVIIFQAADQARFQRSIPLISGNIQDYLNNTSAVLTNETGKDTSSSAFLQNLDQFWSSDSRTKGYYYYTKSDFYNYLTQSEDSNLTLPMAFDVEITSCKIQKNGPGACTAKVTYEQTAYLDQYGSFVSPFYVGYAYDPNSEGGDVTPDSVKNGEEAIRYTSTEQVLLQLYEEDGSWKIATAAPSGSYGTPELVKMTEVPA